MNDSGIGTPKALAAGSTFVVNSAEDLPDADQADGVCATATGACTSCAAIMRADHTTGPNTVIVPVGLCLLTRVGFDDDAVAGDLDISDDLTIQGAGRIDSSVEECAFLPLIIRWEVERLIRRVL